MSNPHILTIEGSLSSQGLKVAIVAGRFNSFVVDRLIDGAVDALVRTGASASDITLVRCPGAFELPQVARWMVERGGIDAVICLGAVIRGATPHFEYIANETAKGIAQLAVSSATPVAFGVLTTNTLEQAIDRAGAKGGNKGYDAAMTAIEMANLMRTLRQAT